MRAGWPHYRGDFVQYRCGTDVATLKESMLEGVHGIESSMLTLYAVLPALGVSFTIHLFQWNQLSESVYIISTTKNFCLEKPVKS